MEVEGEREREHDNKRQRTRPEPRRGLPLDIRFPHHWAMDMPNWYAPRSNFQHWPREEELDSFRRRRRAGQYFFDREQVGPFRCRFRSDP